MLTLTEAAAEFRNRRISSVELTQQCLANIERLNPTLNAFITVTNELALQQARAADDEVAVGNYRGPLHGVPVAIKDLIDIAGIPTTAASNQLRHNVPTRDAAIVTSLKRSGAVFLGKTNLQEFAYGGSGMVSAYGSARNPWNPDCITGGSSSGSGAAVASGMCVAAIGTDTAGSVRTPAALCGIVGHRPSPGVWSTDGVIPLRKSFDTVGPMTRTVKDALAMLQALSVGGAFAATTKDLRGLRIGIAREGFFDGLDAGVAACIDHAADVIRTLVASICDVTLNVDVKWTNFDAEILEYHHAMLNGSAQLYQPGTLARLSACTAIPKAEFDKAVADLATARRNAQRLFEVVDVVLTPTVPVPAPTVAELLQLSVADLRAYEVNKLLRNTAPFSMLFWPTVSVPCGFTSTGLPVGLQISARPGADEIALQLAQAYEQATAGHKRTPPIFA